jgi:hypothetical protein
MPGILTSALCQLETERVTVGDKEVFSKRYETFEMMSEGYIDHETQRGRKVPDYALDQWLMARAFFVLNQAAT